MKQTAKTANDKPERKKPGRPRKSQQKEPLTQELIFKAGLQLSRSVPLQDISIVSVARQLDVVPSVLHYYLQGHTFTGRDALTFGIMNLFFADLLLHWPAADGDWSNRIIDAAKALHTHFKQYPGIAAYIVGSSRFRMIADTEQGHENSGAVVYERLLTIFRAAGFSVEWSVLYIHLLLESTITNAYSAPRPGVHKSSLATQKFDKKDFPNLCAAKSTMLSLNTERTFDEALKLYMQGLYFKAMELRAGAKSIESGTDLFSG